MNLARKPKLVLFTGIMALLVCFVCELVLHAAFRLTNDRWLWLPADVHRVAYVQSVADRREYELVPGYRDDAARLSVTSNGFRRTLPETPSGQRNVVFLGDSVPFGWGVPDEGTYPSAFQQLLLENNIDAAVTNAAVPSYNIRQSLDAWTPVLTHVGNARLVFLQAANDVSLASYFQDDWTPDRTWASLRFQLPDGPHVGCSALAYYLRSALTRAPTSSTVRSNRRWSTREVERNLRQELGRFLQDREAEGIRIVVLPIDPFYYQTKKQERNAALPLAAANRDYQEHWSEMIDSVNQCLADICASRTNAVFLDTRPVLDDADRAILYRDFIHLTVEGNRLLARFLFDCCKRKGLFE